MTHIRITPTPNGRTLIVGFQYDPRAVDAISAIPGARWYNNAWRVSAVHADAVETWRAEHEARFVATAARKLAVNEAEKEARRLEDEARQAKFDTAWNAIVAETKADRKMRTLYEWIYVVGTREDVDAFIAAQLKRWPPGGYGTRYDITDLGDGIVSAEGHRYVSCD